MNGVHDLGGMHGMGPIQNQRDQPAYHERWEARAFALTLAMAAWRKWTLDGTRHQRELIPAAEYLRMSYYGKWFAALVELLVKSDLVTGAEVESGKPAPSSTKGIPPLIADKVLALVARGAPATCTQLVIRACRAIREGGRARSTETTAFLCSRTLTPIFSVRSQP